MYHSKLLTSILALGFALNASAVPKNFIIVMTDDQGYNDLSCFGSKTIKTPHIDQLAVEGMKLKSFYSASSVCTPSRAALLTGRMPKRVSTSRVLFPNSKTGLPEKETTLAEMFKSKGYATALVGKWHLGHQKQFMPFNQGFDYFFGIPYSNDMTIAEEFDIAKDVKLNEGYTLEKLKEDQKRYKKEYGKLRNKVPMMRGNEIIEYPVDQTTITQAYAKEAVAFIKENKDKPFFLYIAHTMPHRPLFIDKDYKGRSEGGIYGDIIERIDWSIGEVVKALKESGLEKDTFILYTSDNGHAGGAGGSSYPLRGQKFTIFEGGHRVPTVIWSPGEIPAGSSSEEMVSSLDVFPTLAHFIDFTPEKKTYDGFNMAEFLQGKVPSPRKEFFYYFPNSENIGAIRSGDWKYMLEKVNRKAKESTPVLYNLKDDIGETTNLIEQHPEKAKALAERMRAFDAAIQK